MDRDCTHFQWLDHISAAFGEKTDIRFYFSKMRKVNQGDSMKVAKASVSEVNGIAPAYRIE